MNYDDHYEESKDLLAEQTTKYLDAIDSSASDAVIYEIVILIHSVADHVLASSPEAKSLHEKPPEQAGSAQCVIMSEHGGSRARAPGVKTASERTFGCDAVEGASCYRPDQGPV